MGDTFFGILSWTTNTAASTQYYAKITGKALGTASVPTETVAQSEIGAAGRVTGVTCEILSTNGTGVVVSLRKNGADAITFTIPDNTSGTYAGSADISVAAGDLLCWAILATSTLLKLNLYGNFTADGAHGFWLGGGGYSFSTTASATSFASVLGNQTGTTTETNMNTVARFQFTMSRFNIGVHSNSKTTSSTMGVRNNGATGNNIVTIPASTTGHFVDTTHSDTISSGSTYGFYFTNGTSTAAISILAGYVYCVPLASEGSVSDVGYASQASVGFSASTQFMAIFGNLNISGATEAQCQIPLGYDCIATRLRTKISVNSLTGSSTIKSRVNTAYGNQVATITAATTGAFEDTTNSDRLLATDQYCWGRDGGTSGAITIATVFNTITERVPTGGWYAGNQQARVELGGINRNMRLPYDA